MMTRNELRQRIIAVSTITDPQEAAGETCKIYASVLRAIADGVLEHRRLARDVLELEHMRTDADATR